MTKWLPAPVSKFEGCAVEDDDVLNPSTTPRAQIAIKNEIDLGHSDYSTVTFTTEV